MQATWSEHNWFEESQSIKRHIIAFSLSVVIVFLLLAVPLHMKLNFVEDKKSTIGKKSKINHLSYIGDSEIGKGVNVGAGTITCNYDGVKKSKTKIKDNVFIGSNSSLVAPITLEKNSIVGAGSVITKKVKKNSLALTRSSQTEVKNYKRKIK